MTFNPMPELATGLTNIFIAVSAVCCLVYPPRSEKAGPWRLFFGLTALAAVCGTVLHTFILPAGVKQALWIGFDLCLGPMLALLVLGAWQDLRGTVPARLCHGLWLLGGLTSLGLVALLLGKTYSAQFPLAAAAAIAAVTAYMILQLLGWRSRGRTPAGLIGPLLILSFGFTWLLADFTTNIGPIQLTPAGWLHLGLALALPFIAKAAGTRRDKTDT